jgi:hypothetical protein
MPVAWQDISRWPMLLNLRLPEDASVELIAGVVTDLWTESVRVFRPTDSPGTRLALLQA